jgi:hypothetical protein
MPTPIPFADSFEPAPVTVTVPVPFGS